MIALDHIVITSANPKKAAQEFAKKHQVVAVQGGKHQNWGTWNWLCHFNNDCYLEWIGIFDNSIAQESENPLIQNVVKALNAGLENIVQLAFRTDQIDVLKSDLIQFGHSVIGPVPGSRSLSDGSTLEWQMLFTVSDSNHPLPFFIEWGEKLPGSDIDLNQQRISHITVPEIDRQYYEQLLGKDNPLANTKLNFGTRDRKSVV